MKFNNKTKTELKSVDFAKENIILRFRGGKPEGCLSYSSVKNMEVTIDNSVYTYKGSEHVRIDNIHILMLLNNDTAFELNTKGALRQIYALIDLQKRVGAFKLTLSGAADTIDFVLRIYAKTGKKFDSFVRDGISNIKVFAGLMLCFPLFVAFTGEKEFTVIFSLWFVLISICCSFCTVVADLRKNALRKELGL